jgi:hypothetical protein
MGIALQNLTRLAGVILLHAVGAPLSYPPGKLSFVNACLVNLIGIAMAATLTNDNRLRLASLTGAATVQLQLGELTTDEAAAVLGGADTDEPLDDAPGNRVEAMNGVRRRVSRTYPHASRSRGAHSDRVPSRRRSSDPVLGEHVAQSRSACEEVWPTRDWSSRMAREARREHTGSDEERLKRAAEGTIPMAVNQTFGKPWSGTGTPSRSGRPRCRRSSLSNSDRASSVSQ